MNVAASTGGVGDLLRSWRQLRRQSQLELGLEAGVSARHLSFVETGRSNPSRELILHLAEHLEVPLRERNTLLVAAGFAPVYGETGLDDEAMGPVRHALAGILSGHEPFPAVIVDRRWNLVLSNEPARSMLTEGVAPELLEPPANALRVTLHPEGLAPRIANLAEWGAHVLTRVQRELALSHDPALAELRDELAGYPGVGEPVSSLADSSRLLFVPLRLRTPAGDELSLFSTLATFGTALDVTLAELSIESFYPADRETEAVLRARVGRST